jgi:hypothetical protein
VQLRLKSETPNDSQLELLAIRSRPRQWMKWKQSQSVRLAAVQARERRSRPGRQRLPEYLERVEELCGARNRPAGSAARGQR